MQADLTVNPKMFPAELLGILHEIEGNYFYGQPKEEENMDLWNNEIGRNIGKEIKNNEQYKAFSEEQIED